MRIPPDESVGNGRWQARFNAVMGQWLHDDTGRERQNLGGLHAHQFCQCHTGAAGTSQPLGPGTRVGVASVDQHRTNARACGGPSLLKMLATHLDRSRAKSVLGKHARHAGTILDQHNREIFAVGFAHTGFGNADSHARDGVKLGGVRCRQVDGHTTPSDQFAVHCLYFLPLPQGHGSLRPTRGTSLAGIASRRRTVSSSSVATTSPVSVGAV